MVTEFAATSCLSNLWGPPPFITQAQQLTPKQRKAMVEPKSQKLSIYRQCKVLNVNRSSYYYRPKPIKQEDLDLMRKIDELYLENPSSGSRTIRRQLKRQGIIVSRKKIQRLMRLMGIEAVYPKTRTSKPHPQHKVYPYLLRGLTLTGRIRCGQPT